MTAHGFRATASSLLNESGRWNPDAIERAMSRNVGTTVSSVYNRTEYWSGRVEMMQWWSDRLDELRGVAEGPENGPQGAHERPSLELGRGCSKGISGGRPRK